MEKSANLHESIGPIRRRLWLLLLRAFGIVVLLIVIFTLAATLLVLGFHTNQNPFYRAPLAYLLESYYTGHGSWQGVERLFEANNEPGMPYLRREWQRAILLDAQGRVVIYEGKTDAESVGSYLTDPGVQKGTELVSNGLPVGRLVITRSLLTSPLRLGLEILPPVGMASILLGMLTLLIGLLLMRRVVNPLAEVIAAARQVSTGDLAARVPVSQRRDDLYVLSDSFNHMAEALERNDQQRRALLADIAHELRTPLSVLRGRLEGIVDGIYPADDAHIATALEEVYLLERLVEDLRLLTLAEAGQLPLEIRQIDLLALANKSIETFACQAEELQIELLGPQLPSDLNGSADWSVAGDPQRLEQVIGNLIGNALRYVPTGGQISVRLQRQNGWLCLAIADNGPGVDEADLPYIFERFWRSEKSRARSSGGAGLGLAISKQLVEAMGGQIRARNLPEGGFEASLCLST